MPSPLVFQARPADAISPPRRPVGVSEPTEEVVSPTRRQRRLSPQSTSLDDHRHARKKEQNRQASKRFRERKKEERCQEEQELQALEETNARLKAKYGRLTEAVATLRITL